MPGLYYPNFNHTFPFAGSVLLNNSNNNKFTNNSNQNKSRQDRLPPTWIGQENTTWNQQLNGPFVFNPSTWHDQQKVQMETRPWDQGK